MKKAILFLLCFAISSVGFAQSESSIVMNDVLVKEYFTDYVSEALERGYDVQSELLEKIDYILIVPEGTKVCNLGETNLKTKIISLDPKVHLDRLILKVTLYRELSHVLGVSYDTGSVIMNRRNVVGFSYAAFDDVDIMEIELTKIMSLIK